MTSPTGIWYLVQPSRAGPHLAKRSCSLRPRRLAAPGPDRTVLAATMNDDFSLFPQARFPVYTLSPDNHKSACQGVCAAVYWPPVLASKRPQAGPGVDQHALGIIVRPDGTHQVTYKGRPLYLFYNDAYIPGLPYNGGMASINGAGAHTPWGVFNTIPPLP